MAIVGNATNIILFSEELSKEDIQKLLQAIRDCEQQHFPRKELGIYVFVPTLSTKECTEVVQSITPPFQEGPLTMAFGGDE